MIKKFSIPAIQILLLLNMLVLLFHIGIIIKTIPYEMTWGGRIKSDADMYMLEMIAILVNLFFSFLLLLRGQFIRAILSVKVVNFFLGLFLILYLFNTVGNLFADTTFEKYFAVLTLIFSLLTGIILLGRK